MPAVHQMPLACAPAPCLSAAWGRPSLGGPEVSHPVSMGSVDAPCPVSHLLSDYSSPLPGIISACPSTWGIPGLSFCVFSGVHTCFQTSVLPSQTDDVQSHICPQNPLLSSGSEGPCATDHLLWVSCWHSTLISSYLPSEGKLKEKRGCANPQPGEHSEGRGSGNQGPGPFSEKPHAKGEFPRTAGKRHSLKQSPTPT